MNYYIEQSVVQPIISHVTAAGLGLILVIVLIVVVARCVVTRRRRRKEKSPLSSCKSERESMYYPRGSGASGTHRGDNHRMYKESEDLYPSRAPSPPPPSVPPRPASYTPR